MRYAIFLLAGLAVSDQASALSTGIFLEQLSGQCQGTDSAKGVLPDVPEALSLDLHASGANFSCQMVSSILVNGSQQPSIDLQISSSGNHASALGTGLGQIDYEFSVSGPAGTFVDINVSAAISISGSKQSTGNTTGSWGTGGIGGLPGEGGNGGTNLCSFWGPRPAACLTGAANGAEAVLQYQTTVRANEIFGIILFGQASATAGAEAAGATNAEVQVVIDPAFSFVHPEDAALYTLEFSPNLTPVPLPATAPLLATGMLGLAGWVRRRGRRPLR